MQELQERFSKLSQSEMAHKSQNSFLAGDLLRIEQVQMIMYSICLEFLRPGDSSKEP